MAFKDNVNRICKEKGTTLTAVARSLKWGSATITRINNNHSIPKEEGLNALAQALNVSVADLFREETVDNEYTETQSDDVKFMIDLYNRTSGKQRHELMLTLYEFEERMK